VKAAFIRDAGGEELAPTIGGDWERDAPSFRTVALSGWA
jgi:hypothetical protein